MKKSLAILLAVLSLSSFISIAEAQTGAVPSVAPITKTTAASPPSTQQLKMKDCAAKYHQQNIPKNQYHTFMTGCLKGASTPVQASPTPAPMSTIAPAAPIPPASTK